MYARNDPNATEKWCRRCQTVKPLEAFGRNKKTRDGRTSYCRSCYRQIAREWEYGITQSEFDALLEGQGGRCAICDEVPKDHGVKANKRSPDGHVKSGLHIDHDHETGEIRGLLCINCNHAIGAMKESPDLLRRAIVYLHLHGK